jgi:hypothetical protein
MINNITSNHEYLDSDKIPWECRRNKSIISKFTNVYWNKNTFILSENTFIPNDLKQNFRNGKINMDNNVKKINKGYFHFALFFSNIGHFFTDDIIPIYKMILLNEDDNNKDINIIFLKNSDELPEYQILNSKNKQLLLPFTNNKIQFLKDYDSEIFLKEVIIFHKYYSRKIHPITIGGFNEPKNPNYKYFKNLVQIYKHNSKSVTPYKVVILSRKNAKYRKIINENDLFNELKQIYKNVELVEFEKLSINEQINLMNETKIFITPHGAGVISGFFMQPHTKCIIIHPYGYPTNCDYPVIYKTYMKALNIECIQWTNTIKNKYNNLFECRDRNFYLNLNDFLKCFS